MNQQKCNQLEADSGRKENEWRKQMKRQLIGGEIENAQKSTHGDFLQRILLVLFMHKRAFYM